MSLGEFIMVLITLLILAGTAILIALYRRGKLLPWPMLFMSLVAVNGIAMMGAVWYSNVTQWGAPGEPIPMALSYWSGAWVLHLLGTLVGITANYVLPLPEPTNGTGL